MTSLPVAAAAVLLSAAEGSIHMNVSTYLLAWTALLIWDTSVSPRLVFWPTPEQIKAFRTFSMWFVKKNNFQIVSVNTIQASGWTWLKWITRKCWHYEITCQWVNFAPIFFWYHLLPLTFGPQKFSKIGVLKSNYFHSPT